METEHIVVKMRQYQRRRQWQCWKYSVAERVCVCKCHLYCERHNVKSAPHKLPSVGYQAIIFFSFFDLLFLTILFHMRMIIMVGHRFCREFLVLTQAVMYQANCLVFGFVSGREHLRIYLNLLRLSCFTVRFGEINIRCVVCVNVWNRSAMRKISNKNRVFAVQRTPNQHQHEA